MSDKLVIIDRIGKVFTDLNNHETRVLKDVAFAIHKGDFITVFGPNSSGKTTLLNIVAGIEKPAEGQIVYGKPNLKIGYVFQNYAESLLSWRTVAENIRLPLEKDNFSRQEKSEKLERVVNLLNLAPFKNKYPYLLSGGKKQLTALARALIVEPDLLIMDEPFSSLDYPTIIEMERLIMDIWQKLNITILFVSHDIEGAIFLADKVLVMSNRITSQYEVVEVNLERPRSRDMLAGLPFLEIKKRIIKKYEEKL